MEAAIVSGILKVIDNKLVSLLASEFAAITGVKTDLLELQGIHGEIVRLLSTIRDLSAENDPRFGWVINLKHVAYDIDDLLYEVHLEAEKHKIVSAFQKNSIIDSLRAKPMSLLYRYKVAQKIMAIKATLATIAKQRSNMNAIGHNIPLSQTIFRRNKANVELFILSNVEESQIPTRNLEKVSIINKLLESNEGEHDWKLSVVGLGGSGKTTLAKHICHDNKIKEWFKDKIYWVHVSQEFDLKNLVGKVFEAITKEKSDLHTTQHVLDEISKKLTGEKFLLVLDDAWHQDKEDWNKFMVNVRSGKVGSKLMITTRDQKVAEAVESGHIFNLAFLSEVESWSLFLKNSGWKEDDLDSEFIQFGKEIVNKCGGVPLAIKTLGGILRDKREISTWRAISQSDLWNEENIEDRVFASLILSYIHLKDCMKECFLFCSIFPKGYRINKNYLIEQWIANGFIKQMIDEQPEVTGGEYFDLLVKVGFLQDPFESRHGNGVEYKMHDLIHDLTRYILRTEVATSPSMNITKGCTQKCRYLSLTSYGKKVERVFFDNVRALCVLEGSPSLHKLVKKSRYLCSVVLEYEIDGPFPQFILKLDYLGYLEIHNVSCTKLPEGISDCWNLQSLHFISCKGFAALPKSIGKLKKLRTLELTCTDIESLPPSIGNCCDLHSLQIQSCQKFKEIPNTICKNEKLRLLHIVDCIDLQQVASEDIGAFGSIQTLSLAGCTSLKDLPSTFSFRNLHTLNLSETRLAKLPEFVTFIENLQSINLEACHDLLELPKGIGNLKRLEVLNLKGCWSLQWMPSGFQQLTRLRRLDLYVVGCGEDDARISDLENLDMISGDMELKNIPHLMDSIDAEKACLKKKKLLRSLMLHWSKNLNKEEFDLNIGVLDALEPPSQIEKLHIVGYRGPYLPCWMSTQGDLSCLKSTMLNQTSSFGFHCLVELRLCEISNLKHMRGIQVFPSLKILQLVDMPNLEELRITTSDLEVSVDEMAEQYCFPVLSHLGIYHCPKLIVEPYFPPSLEWLELRTCNGELVSRGRSSINLLPPCVDEPSIYNGALSTTPQFKELKLSGLMTKLESLELRFCPAMTELPVSMRGLRSLKRLDIYECSTLAMLPEWLGELQSLRTISISKCPMMANLPWSIGNLTSLMWLGINECDNLKQLPDAIQHLKSLEELWLAGCNALTELPNGIGKLSSLQRLYIEDCPALQSLPSSIQYLYSLERLLISGCPELARRYKKEVEDDWHHVSHILVVVIS